MLEKVLREMDALAQLENGECAAILPNGAKFETGRVAERMQTTLNGCAIPLLDRELHVDVRRSVAELETNETTHALLAWDRHELAPAATGPIRRPIGT